MEEQCEEFSDVGSTSSDSFIDEDDVSFTSGQDEGLHLEEPLTEKEIDELISEFLEVESKAAEAQEALEKESLAKVEIEVREELAETLHGENLEIAVADEMDTLRAEWETTLDELENESAHLLEQLDGVGIDLPRLYKLIESEAPNGCCTDAWKKRIHWVGSQVTQDLTESITDAEKTLEIQRPVRRKLGKLLEEGASGYLQKKFSSHEGNSSTTENSNVEWGTLNKIFCEEGSGDGTLFGSKHWASVYLANTPQQAALMGLNFPGVNEVEEIDDIDKNSSDPFVEAAIANEIEMDLSEEQKKFFKKVKEEDDAKIDKKLHIRLKQRRVQKKHKQEVLENKTSPNDVLIKDNGEQSSSPINYLSHMMDKTICDERNNVNDEDCGRVLKGFDEPQGSKRSNDSEELITDTKKSRISVIDSGYESSLARETLISIDDFNGLEKINTSELGLILPNTLNEKFSCTACDKEIVEAHAHPLLNVIICGECKCLMEEKMNRKLLDPDGSECYCAWCGRSSELVSCKSCNTLFCSTCITKNVGVDCLSDLLSSGWHCCCCCPNLLHNLTAHLVRATGTTDLEAVGANSNSDSDNSDSDVNVALSSKRKHKKKIRRILDDAELGEETKKKIAIEMERQERLKSLQVQFSARSKMMSFAGSKRSLSEDETVEVLGDASTGFIVNVVRENGEEAVRIPPSISVKLKAHQISGIRFMWENIMQSIRRVKSGDKGLGCILAHTMGLGKTFQVIAFLYTAMRSIELGLRTVLIVTPVNVLHNWRQEFLKWSPSELKSIRVYMLEDVARERRLELLKKWRRKGGVFLIGYTAFRNLSLGKHVKDRHIAKEITRILQDGPDILVCDEAHMIKNTKADITQALKQVKCQRRIALTGSPLQNNLMEYYCMVDFVREGFLGSSHEFRNRFQNPIEQGQHTNSTLTDVKIMNQRSHILYEQLKGFVQRMDVNVAKKDLPPKTVFVISVKLSSLQRKLYKRFLDEHGFTRDKLSGINLQKRSFFAGYQALAQIWNHPGILQITKEDKDNSRREHAVENFLPDDCSSDENNDFNTAAREKPRTAYDTLQSKNGEGFFRKDWWNGLLHENNFKQIDYSGKMVLLLEILTMCSDFGDKALVFSQSIPTLDLIELYLSSFHRQGKSRKLWKKGKDWYRLDGRTESSERQRLVERFNEPLNERVKCTLISTRAGSLGINLHSANRVIIVDGSWNPTYDLQAIYRAWRYGQTKHVFVYRLLAHGTMEEKIYKRQVTKEGLAARVVDRQQVHRMISKEEMSHLFEFGDEENADASELSQGHRQGHSCNQNMAEPSGNLPKQVEPLSKGSCPSDRLMESLLSKHQPRWIINYHEHETLLQENEEEKLSKEEQDKAWEVYQKTLEWEEQQKVPQGNVATGQKQEVACPDPEPEEVFMVAESKPRNRFFQRKCTILSHMLTLRSQGTKAGSHAVCGECAQEISWDDLNDGRRDRPTYVV